MDKASAENDASMITHNREAQHKYLTWRAEKVFFLTSSFFFYSHHPRDKADPD